MSRRKRPRPRARPGSPPTPRRPGPRSGAEGGGGRLRPSVLALLAAALLLGFFVDDRHVGLVADGRQMIRTAVAISETGEIGLARGTDFSWPREEGDSVSRFGMGTSLLQVPAAWLAPRLEARRGAGASQSLFLVLPFLGVLVAGWAAGRATAWLGGGEREQAWAVLFATVGSALGSYSAMEFSEPVQAAALGLALAAALAAGQDDGRRGDRLAVAAGAAAGFAVLTKSSLIAVSPWTLLPILASRRRWRRVVRAGLGALPLLLTWMVFELQRFGQLFGGYPDDRFTNPFFDGLWRLSIGPNRGLLLYFPVAFVAALWSWAILRWGGLPQRLAVAGSWLATAAMITIAAPYWGWHGMEGWGPRLIVPAVVLLSPLAARWFGDRRPWVGWTAVGLLTVLNLPPLLQHPTPVATYIMNCSWPTIAAERAGDFPFYSRGEDSAGRPTVVPFEVLERTPAASPFVVFPWFTWASHSTGSDLATKLAHPPWIERRPEIVPPDELLRSPAAQNLAPQPRIGFLGRSLLAGPGQASAQVYADALFDQVIRAQQQRRTERALRLARKLVRLVPDGESDALMLESLRLADDPGAARSYLSSLSRSRRTNPKINVVLALFDRDDGDESSARRMLRSVVGSFPPGPVHEALAAPLADWPADLHEMTLIPRRDASIAAPAPP